jgi:hypothetical protein
MDRERLASGHVAEGVSFAFSAPEFSLSEATCFNTDPFPATPALELAAP